MSRPRAVEIEGHQIPDIMPTIEVWDLVPVEVDTGIVDQHGRALCYTIEPEPIGFFRFSE